MDSAFFSSIQKLLFSLNNYYYYRASSSTSALLLFSSALSHTKNERMREREKNQTKLKRFGVNSKNARDFAC